MAQKELLPDPLANLRDAGAALAILAAGKDEIVEQIQLCVCCVHAGTSNCPHQGQEPKGLCSGYVLDERNPADTEKRLMFALQAD